MRWPDEGNVNGMFYRRCPECGHANRWRVNQETVVLKCAYNNCRATLLFIPPVLVKVYPGEYPEKLFVDRSKIREAIEVVGRKMMDKVKEG